MIPRARPSIREDFRLPAQLRWKLPYHFSLKDISEGVENGLLIYTEIPSVSVIIPALNEAKNLPFVLPKIPSWVFEVILVDGHSSDDTVQVAQQLLPDILIVEQSGRGKGEALRTGFSIAKGDILVMLDADGSTDPAAIPAFVSCLLSGVDYAKGSRFLPNAGTDDMGLLRKLGNWGFIFLVRIFFGGNFTDLCFGYNAFWRDALRYLYLASDGFEIETEMNIQVLRANLWIAEVPCFEAARLHGTSNLRTFRDGWRVLYTILQQLRQANRRDMPAKLKSRNSPGILK